MNTTRKMSFLWIGLFISSAILLFTTCKGNIGLGGTVDINRPVIRNDSVYPPMNAVVRGDFVVAADVEDDNGVESVFITLKHKTDAAAPLKEGYAEERSGQWRLSLNAGSLIDGKYEVSITAKDKSGKSANVKTSLTIDNTPPLLVLQRPSTAAETLSAEGAYDIFGDRFLLVGEVYDANPIETLKITAKDKDGTQKEKILHNIPHNIRLPVDSFSSLKEDFYRGLYGTDQKAGKKPFTYSLEVCDNAKVYQKPGDNGAGSGNSTDVYYLYDEIYAEVLSKHKLSEVYAMKQKYRGNADDASGEEKKLLQYLNKLEIKIGGDGKRQGTFALDPTIDPRYNVAGYEPKQNPEDFHKIYSPTVLNVKLLQNLDGDPLKAPDAYTFYMLGYGEYEQNSSFDINDDQSIYSDVANKTLHTWIKKLSPKMNREGGGYIADIAIDAGELNLAYGKTYIVQVRGADQKDHPLIADVKGTTGGFYGFKMVRSGKLPEVSIDKINNRPAQKGRFYVKKGEDAVFTVKVTETNKGQITYTLTGQTAKTVPYNLTAGGTNEIPVKIPKSAFNSDIKSYNLAVKAEDEEGRDSLEQNYTLYYDAEGPVITVQSPTKDVILNMGQENLTIKGTANDYGAGLKTPVVVKLQKPDGNDAAIPFAGSPGQEKNGENWVLRPIDLSTLGEGKYTLTVTAEDLLGQQEILTQKFVYDAKNPEITEVMGMSRANIKSGKVIHVSEASPTISGRIDETHGIEWVKIKKTQGGTYTNNLLTPGTKQFTYQPTLTDGEHEFEICVRDKAEKEDTITVKICVDTKKPVFKKMQLGFGTNEITDFPEPLPSVLPEVVTGDATVSVKGTLFDAGAGLAKVEAFYTLTDGSSKTVPFSASADGNGLYSIDGALKLPLGATEITFTAYDKANPVKTQTWKVRVTVESQELTLQLGIKSDETGHYPLNADDLKDGAKYVKGKFTLTAQGACSGTDDHPFVLTATKDGAPADLSGFYTSVTPAAGIALSGDHKKITGFKSGKKSEPATLYDIVFTPRSNQQDDGSYVFTIDANPKKAQYTVVVDTKPPVLTPRIPIQNQALRDSPKLFALISDVPGIGIKEVTAKLNGSDVPLTISGSSIESTGVLNLTTPANTVVFNYKDLLGNSGTETISFRYDAHNPVLSDIEVNDQKDGQVLVGLSSSGNITPFTVKGKVQDSEDMESVTVSISKVGSTFSKTFDPIIRTGSTKQDWDKEIKASDLQPPYAGTYTLTIKAQDAAGRVSVQTRTVETDTESPKVKFEAPYDSHATPSQRATVNKIITIRGTANDNRKLKSVKIVTADGRELVAGSVSASTGDAPDKAVFTDSKAYNWSFKFDTSKYSDGNLTLKVIAVDSVGNITPNPSASPDPKTLLNLKIDQHSDRPQIVLTNLSGLNGGYLTSDMLNFVIVDDDGEIENGKFEIISDPPNAGTLTKTLGGWRYKFNTDGKKKLSFKVTDRAGEPFETAKTPTQPDVLKRPRVYAVDTTTASADGAVELNVDTKPPQTEDPAIQFSLKPDYSDLKDLAQNTKFKADEKFYVQLKASDANGIKSIKGKLGDTEVFSAAKTSGTSPAAETWRKGDVTFTAAQAGAKELTIEITDNAGAVTKFSRTIIIDAQAPTIEQTYPKPDSAQSGTITVQGGITDGANSAGVNPDKTQWKIAKKTEQSPQPQDSGWNSMKTSTAANWLFELELEEVFKPAGHAAYGTPNTGTPGYYDIPVYIRTEDAVGNKDVRKITVLYNPDGTKPVMEILSPSADTVVGGTIQVFGTGRVAVGTPADIGKVYIQFSTDSTFNSANCTINGKNWWNGGTGEVVPGTDGSGSGASWRIEVNSDGKLNPTTGERWDVWFRVRGENKTVSNKLGEWTQGIKIIVDKSAPTIGSKIPLKLELNAGSPPPSVDYVPNMWIKDGYILTGSLHDESGIKTVTITGDLENGAEYNLAQAKAKGWVVKDEVNKVVGSDGLEIPGKENYKLRIPLDLDTLKPAAKNAKEFKVHIRITEDTDKNLEASKEFVFKYDIEKPAGDFGGKIYVSHKNFTANSVDDTALADRLRNGYTDKRLLIGNVIAKITGVAGNTVSFAPVNPTEQVKAGTYNFVLYEPEKVITDETWTARGVANDDGSGVKEVKAWVEVGSNKTTEAICTLGHATNKISRELGTQCTWEAQIGLSSIPDGRGTVYYEIFDDSGNSSGKKSFAIFVRRKALTVSKAILATEVAGNTLKTDDIQADNTSKDEEKNFTGVFSKNDFAFKSLTASSIELELVGSGEGDKTYSVYPAASLSPDGNTVTNKGTPLAGHNGKPWPAGNTIQLTEADLTTIDNSAGDDLKALVIEIRDSYHGITAGDLGAVTVIVKTKFKALDDQKPSVVILPFYWNGEGKSTDGTPQNSLYEGSRSNGHVEIGDVAGLTAGSSVSGKVSIRGFAYDNVQLNTLTATLPDAASVTITRNGSTWSVGSDSAKGIISFTVEKSDYDYRGYYLRWRIDWDTEKAAVGTGKDIKVTAHDGKQASLGTNADLPSEVTAVVRTISTAEHSSFANAKPGQFLVLKKDERVYLTRVKKISGQTLTLEKDIPDDATTVELYPYTANKPAVKVNIVPYITKLETLVSGNAGKEFGRSAKGLYPVYTGEKIKLYGFNLTQTPVVKMGSETLTVGALTGGYYPVTVSSTEKSGNVDIEVGGVKAINNINAEPIFDEHGKPTKVPYNVQANTANKYLNDDIKLAIWKLEDFGLGSKDITSPIMKMDKGGKWYMSYGKGIPEMMVNTNGTENRIDFSYNKFHNTDVAFDGSGNIYSLATNTDRIGNHSAKFSFYSRFGAGLKKNNSGSYISGFDSGSYQYCWTGKARLEKAHNQGIYNINRVKRPKMVVTGTTAAAKVYMVYFDSNHPDNPVKFRYGTVNSTNSFTGGIKDGGTGATPYVSDAMDTLSNGSSPDFHTVADKNTAPDKPKGGEYAAVGVTSGGVAVVAWYDASEKRLVYSWNDTPQTIEPSGSSNKWQTNAKVIDSGYAGWYVDLAVDENDGIHIAYYNSAKGDLKYAYLSSYNAAPAEVVTVDSYLSVGTQIMITTRKEGANNVPYISYYHPSFTQTTSSVRVAWRTDFTSLKDGAKDDSFTGAWEAMTVPTQDVPKEETVCHGVPTAPAWADKMMLGFMTYNGYKKATLKK